LFGDRKGIQCVNDVAAAFHKVLERPVGEPARPNLEKAKHSPVKQKLNQEEREE